MFYFLYSFNCGLRYIINVDAIVGSIFFDIIYAAFGFEEVLNIIKTSGGKTYEEFEISNDLMKGLYLKPIQRLVKKKMVPVFYIGPQGYSNPWVREFINSNIPIFDLWDMPVKCFSVLAKYSKYRKKFNPKFENWKFYEIIRFHKFLNRNSFVFFLIFFDNILDKKILWVKIIQNPLKIILLNKF